MMDSDLQTEKYETFVPVSVLYPSKLRNKLLMDLLLPR